MDKNNIALGKRGEEEAVCFLKSNGYQVLERNFRNKLGEIDIIAKENKVLCFIEVKTRANTNFGYPQEAVTLRKQKQLNKVALSYLKQYNLIDTPARFDIVSVILHNKKAEIEVIKDAFSL
jgi:putative endonuclease